MKLRAWIFQDPKQVAKHGAAKAAWYYGWYEPNGKRRCKSCGPGREGKRIAEQLRRQTHANLTAGTYETATRQTWADFRKQFDAKILAGMEPNTRLVTKIAIDHFQRLAQPRRMRDITTKTVDDFIAARRLEPGKRKEST